MARNTEHIKTNVNVGSIARSRWVSLDHTVTYKQVGKNYKDDPVYAVLVDDSEIGCIERTEKQWSTHSPNGKIRLADHSAVAWRIVGDKWSRLPYDSRRDAAIELLKRHMAEPA